jgi:hypothetical protein
MEGNVAPPGINKLRETTAMAAALAAAKVGSDPKPGRQPFDPDAVNAQHQLRVTAAKAAARDNKKRGLANDKPGTRPGHGDPRTARGPPGMPDFDAPPRACFTINEFCAAHGISPAFYYKLKSLGLGPDEMKIGSRRLISFEAAARWRAEREVAQT